ncbi:hypothetical protein EYR41_006765 [Orbilia oligospora]|uniref:Uncharacterized protein n=1 Tax=Orbilia oligospora TaxID=2813651 RepID=A0A7C8TX86_ORBOL|nr:hypothetical protein TWF751_000193 [Orbilia oligospora]TGJ67651.1 hypothetical protein EYR41_006765 [Orbilia oligospora]
MDPTMNDNQASSKILRIPLEVRDAIYSHLFDLCQRPDDPKLIHPAYDPKASPSEREDSLFTLKYGYNGSLRIKYYNTLPKYQLLPVLQTCQQIRSEFQDFLHRTLNKEGENVKAGGKGLRYELNLTSHRLLAYPTWVVLPLPPEEPYNVIDELWVNYEIRDYTQRGGRFYACGGPGTEPHTLFHLLSNFLFHGPQGFYLPAINDLSPDKDGKRPSYNGGRCNPKIKHLILNISFHEASQKIKGLEKLEADVESGKPGAQADLEQVIRAFEESKKDAAGWVEQNVGRIAENNYFDGHVEMISVFFEGLEMWQAEPDWADDEEDGEDQDYPLTHSITIDRGFNRAPDWKENSDFVQYSFIWGPKPESQRGFTDEQLDNGQTGT